ncbi:MAG: serine/threonine-protein kinase [Pirellulales bacterium]|nr:serine/threonine-protein kinase [Pirellulales bacterium]
MGFLQAIRALFSNKVDIAQRFEIEREAISGTMSEFFAARDRQTGKMVGLKIQDKDKTEAVESRFKALKKPSEGEIALGMDHPRIVKTLEHGTTTDNRAYILMEFLDGPGLNSLIISKSELLNGNRLALLRQAAEALDYVHGRGYIHRDICPRNFVCSKDATSLKLIDFGLTLPAKAEYMQPGNRVGTPNYLAPEVVRRKKTDQRLDIFAFGVTAFELFALELPWPKGKSTGMDALNHDKIEPRQITQLCPRIDPVLGETIMQCLQIDPAARPQSLRAFLQKIEKVKRETID